MPFHLKHNVASPWLSEKYDFNTGIEASLYLFVSSVCLGRRCVLFNYLLLVLLLLLLFSHVSYISIAVLLLFLCLLLFSLPLQKRWIDFSLCMINITVQLKQCLLKYCLCQYSDLRWQFDNHINFSLLPVCHQLYSLSFCPSP